jgi:hypothetical protein
MNYQKFTASLLERLSPYLTFRELLNLSECSHYFSTFVQSAVLLTTVVIPARGFPHSLRELNLWKTNVSNTDWLIPLHSLERLTIACVKFDGWQVVYEGITVHYNRWELLNELIVQASKLPRLYYFSLSGIYFDDDSVIDFPPQIRHLVLCDCCFTSVQLQGIKSLPPHLEILDLRSNALYRVNALVMRNFWSLLPRSLHTIDVRNNFLNEKLYLNNIKVLQD